LKAEYRIKQLTAAEKQRLVADLVARSASSAYPESKNP
jgi:predicted GIY-YIG superfamily endonuclease